MRFKILKQGGYGASGGLSESGGNMSGPLVLAGNPTQPLHASTKGYVDSALSNLNGASLITGLIPVERLPAFTGDITNVAGSNVFSLSNSGVTPSTYPKVTVNAKGRITNGYLLSEADLPGLDWNKVTTGKPNTRAGYGITDGIAPSGGTMTGDLIVNNDPTAPLHIATKGYVDAVVAGNSSGSVKTGDMIRKTTSTTPSGFLKCNGGDVSKTVYPALYSVIGDTYSASNIPGVGQPWISQYDINNANQVNNFTWSQSVRFNDATEYGDISGCAVVVTKNRVYFIGGTLNSNYTGTIYSSVINSDGSLGAITAVSSLSFGTLGMSHAIVTKNRVYLIGGVINNSDNHAVYTAPINADGTLGSFTSSGTFPAHVRTHAVGVWKNYVYVVGGYNTLNGSVQGDFTGYSRNIFRGTIAADGTIGSWINYPNALPIESYNHGLAIIKDKMYVLGGRRTTNSDASNTILVCSINPDGTLSAFSTSPVTLPEAMHSEGPTFITKNNIYLAHYTKMFRIPINADGTLGTSVIDSTIPIGIYQGRGFITSSGLHVFGASGGADVNAANIYKASFNGGQNDYSLYYSGTLTATDPTNFRLPDFSAKEMPGSFTYIKA